MPNQSFAELRRMASLQLTVGPSFRRLAATLQLARRRIVISLSVPITGSVGHWCRSCSTASLDTDREAWHASCGARCGYDRGPGV